MVVKTARTILPNHPGAWFDPLRRYTDLPLLRAAAHGRVLTVESIRLTNRSNSSLRYSEAWDAGDSKSSVGSAMLNPPPRVWAVAAARLAACRLSL